MPSSERRGRRKRHDLADRCRAVPPTLRKGPERLRELESAAGPTRTHSLRPCRYSRELVRRFGRPGITWSPRRNRGRQRRAARRVSIPTRRSFPPLGALFAAGTPRPPAWAAWFVGRG